LFPKPKIRKKEKKIMRKLMLPLFSLTVLVSLVLAACGTPAATPVATAATAAAPAAAGGARLQAILDRGKVICGVHGTFQGFGFVDSAGNWTGFDVDFCRAWAAALFNDPAAVEFRGLSAQDRFTTALRRCSLARWTCSLATAPGHGHAMSSWA
jgi:ABC-type amino acid transport substrate-binding protein